MGRLSGRTAIVTGGAKGIGRHYSLALAADGARVMIADISDGKEVAEEIAAKHGANSVTSAIADVSDEGSVKALVAATMERFGRIDVLVNNAALFAPLQETKCTEIDADLWDKVMAVNLRGPFVPDGEARRSAHDRARLWQDHQYRLGQRASRHPLDPALRHQQGRHHGVHAGARPRARYQWHPGQHAGARLHPERHGDEREPGPCADRPRPRGRITV